MVASILPLLSFIGMWFKPESSSFTAETFIRQAESIQQEGFDNTIATQNGTDKPQAPKSGMSNMEFPPFGSRSIYKPLMLITSITCLKHFSGVSFTKKFLLQILAPKSKNGDPRLPTLFAIGITTIRLFANLYMAKLIKKTRLRFLFFFSLFTTAVCLIILGIFLDDNLIPGISESTTKYIRVGLLALHIFLVQFGLQSISNNMTDLLFPTKYKSVMKGFTGAIFYISLVIVTSALTITVDCQVKYSWTFWIMGSVLILASPLLFVFVPEVRNIGRAMAGEFYMKSTTVFHIILEDRQKKDNRKSRIFGILQSPLPAQRSFKSQVKHVMALQSLQNCKKETNRTAEKRLTMQSIQFKRLTTTLSMIGSNQERLSHSISRQETVLNSAKEAPAVVFDTQFEQMKDLQNSEANEERVAFINCIHSQRGFLENNKNKNRVLIGKGPIVFEENFLLRNKGGIFLFNDIVLISHCIRANLRYVNETVFHIDDDSFVIKVEDRRLMLSNAEDKLSFTVDEESTAKTWGKYINFVKNCKN